MPGLNGDIDRQIDAALEQQRNGRLAEAEAAYRAILDQEPDHAETHQLLGLLLYQRGDTERALGELRNAVRLAPDVMQFGFNLGLVQTAAQAFAVAIPVSRKTKAEMAASAVGDRPDAKVAATPMESTQAFGFTHWKAAAEKKPSGRAVPFFALAASCVAMRKAR